ncbi:glutathione-disulfide reductase [Hahella sp. CCB-MM4]|uniref:glutathione-disulfide reductase n=1 Tax=Hahella sp. (strain CCB-MM4) TaxID=1926491 RepID=UPI000B9B77BE|nr:glutathione-disulfide reductase [Hahella sp. CCB-MM4]OZG73365.1 glutathione-disulfide reductase [Hahella sp. CCB-MM4]
MYDLIVIGAGSGGVRCARMSAQKGAKVAIIEERFYGGTCVNVGCVPKKLFVYASHYGEDFHDAHRFGWSTQSTQFDWPTLVENKNAEIARLNGIYENLLKNAGVTIYNGRGRISSPNTVEVNGETLRAKNILIATGSYPFKPDFPGSEHALISDHMFYLDSLPTHAVVVGGGYIAVEFAGILAGLGVSTHLIYRGSSLLKRFDGDVRHHLAEELDRKGIKVHLSTSIESMEKLSEKEYRLKLNSGEELSTGLVLYATGRKPLTQDLGLDLAGVALGADGEILVNEDYQTNVPGIYAVGDVINRMQLTPVALAEGMYVANKLFGGDPVGVDYVRIPTAVFSQPSVATVGPTEEEARQQFPQLKVYRSAFRALKNTVSGNQERTMMKLLVDGATDKVIAAHMVGPDAAEIIQGIAIAIRAGATKKIFDTTIGIHPSSAEEYVTMREPVGD